MIACCVESHNKYCCVLTRQVLYSYVLLYVWLIRHPSPPRVPFQVGTLLFVGVPSCFKKQSSHHIILTLLYPCTAGIIMSCGLRWPCCMILLYYHSRVRVSYACRRVRTGMHLMMYFEYVLLRICMYLYELLLLSSH